MSSNLLSLISCGQYTAGQGSPSRFIAGREEAPVIRGLDSVVGYWVFLCSQGLDKCLDQPSFAVCEKGSPARCVILECVGEFTPDV